MKLAKIGAVAAFAMVAATQAQAQNFYGSVGAGVLVPEKLDMPVGAAAGEVKFDTGYALTTALGYDFGNGLRTELELGLNDTGFKSARAGAANFAITGGDVDQLTLHAAGYYDFNMGAVNPYIGGGVGLTRTDVDTYTLAAVVSPGNRATDFSMFGEAGVSIPVTDRLSIAPGVRYSWVDTNGSNLTAWTFRTALRFAF
ncbi:MAG: porin family protein [Rhodospirillaceae bacterium]|nr:porin family protein [Rhodospirillaceae bacterium]